LAAGGVIRPDPIVDAQTGAVINPYHALLDGLTAEQGVALFSDTRPNTTRLRR
jgi:hypothetical protein